jgi:hypothetical protein
MIAAKLAETGNRGKFAGVAFAGVTFNDWRAGVLPPGLDARRRRFAETIPSRSFGDCK